MSFTPYNAPILSGLLGDPEVAAHFSVKADIEAACRFEAALARAQASLDIISEEDAAQISSACADFTPDLADMTKCTMRDGVFVPELLNQLHRSLPEASAEFLHFGTTSQDVIDSSLMLRLRDVNLVLTDRLSGLLSQLGRLCNEYGDSNLSARTRMQAALPVKVADRIGSWVRPLQRCSDQFRLLKPDLEVIQFAGAVGTLHKFGKQGADLRKLLAQELDMNDPGCSWHSDRSRLADYANWLSKLTGVLGKVGQDLVLMAQNEMSDVVFSGGGGSSAMPHKQNPVKAEALVTLARFNATQLSGMHHALVHEQERSGAAWMLEWMVLPQMCVATGAAMNNSAALCASVEQIGYE